MSQSDFVHFDDVNIIKETEKAFLVQGFDPEDPARQKFVPKSQVVDSDNYKEGDRRVNISITRWFAEKEEMA